MERLKEERLKNHLDILKEFYHFNKYYLEEPMKDTLLNAIDCMKYVIKPKDLRWKKHKFHLKLLKKFYRRNRFFMTEQVENTLLDAIACMKFVISETKEKF